MAEGRSDKNNETQRYGRPESLYTERWTVSDLEVLDEISCLHLAQGGVWDRVFAIFHFLPSWRWLCLFRDLLLGSRKMISREDVGGILNGLHVKLHVTVSADGTVGANVDSPDQNMFALACSDIGINGQTLSFTVPNVRGEWMGTSADRTSLSGIWKHRPPDATELYEEWRGALGQQRRTGHCSDTGGTCSECG